MTCTHKANQTVQDYTKSKDFYRRNIYYVYGYGIFTEKDFKKYFEI